MDEINKNFCYVENFLTKEELEFFSIYAQMYHRSNENSFDEDQTKLGETMQVYGTATETLLLLKTKKINKILETKVLPTYSYWRMYTKFSQLDKHTDRKSCEITASVNLGGCGTKWPLFIDGKEVNIKPGDAVIYHGVEKLHWREEFQGDWQAQVFLHYVYKEGKYKDFIYDKRQSLGASK